MMLSIFSCAYWSSVYLLWQNIYSSPLLSFELGRSVFLLLRGRSSLYILDINSLSDIWFANIFSHSVSCLFHSLDSVFWWTKCCNFFKIFIYLFIYFWLCWVFVSVRGLSPAAASGGHSSSRCVGLSLPWPLLLRSTGSRRAGSVVVAHGPNCSAACGIFPDQGSNPCPLHWQADSQPLRHQGSPNVVILMESNLSIFSFVACAFGVISKEPSITF